MTSFLENPDPCLESEPGSDTVFAPALAFARDREYDKASEFEWVCGDGDDGSAGLLSSLFMSTTDVTAGPPSDMYPEDV
jgi:hypothetical protein